MRRCRSLPRFFVFVFVFVLVLVLDARADQTLIDSTIVLYNNSVPESVSVAKFYGQQRGIARDHLVGVDCSSEEEISRTEYDDHIANPLREVFKKRGWWKWRESGQATFVTATSIHFV